MKKKPAIKPSSFTTLLLAQWITTLESPSISRSIPETAFPTLTRLVVSRMFLLNFLSGFLLMGIVLQGFQVSKTWGEYTTLAKHQSQLDASRLYWEGVVARYPNYRDGYYHLAVLAYQEGNDLQAKTYLKKVLEIDPNFEVGAVFAQKIGVK